MDFVPGRELNAFDQLYCRTSAHPLRLVRPNQSFGTDRVPTDIDAGKIYVLDGRDGTPRMLEHALAVLESRAAAAHVQIQTLRLLV